MMFVKFLEKNKYIIKEKTLKAYQIKQAEAVILVDNSYFVRIVTNYKRKEYALDWGRGVKNNFFNTIKTI